MMNMNLKLQSIHIEPEHDMKLYQIANQMRSAKLPDEFIAAAIRYALAYEGIADLVFMWATEEDPKERDEIIADIQELMDDCAQSENKELPSIKLNDLDAIAQQIREFKDALLIKVVEQGGISKLAELTGLPQPSLSRFFNSNSMPQRVTLIKIGKALKLDAVELSTKWSR